jgi:hypothetical protein
MSNPRLNNPQNNPKLNSLPNNPKLRTRMHPPMKQDLPTFEMPKWLRRAMKMQVLTFSQAWTIKERIRLNPEMNEIPLPKEMNDLASKLNLLESRTPRAVM